MKMKTIRASTTNYGRQRRLKDIKYITVHYTANKGDTAKNNCLYFQGANRHASAHIFIDPNEAIISVPINYVAWSVGGKKYPDCSKTGGGKLYGKATNANTLNIELCGSNGYKPNDKELALAVKVVKYYMKELGIDEEHVIRHFDVTGKSCPAYWTDSTKWENEFKSKLKDAKAHTFYKETGVYEVIKVPRPIRATPKTNGKEVGSIKEKAKYTIVEVKGKYGKLKSGAGWICLRDDYVKKVKP